MASDTSKKRSKWNGRIPLVLCLLCTISTLTLAVMVANKKEVESPENIVISMDTRGNTDYLADEKRFNAQLLQHRKRRSITQIQTKQDINDLEICKSVLGEDFEFDPDVVEDPDLVVAIGDPPPPLHTLIHS